MTSFTDSSHNLRFDLGPAKWIDDLNKSGHSALTGYQECSGDAQNKTLTTWCKSHGREIYYPIGTGNPISWESSVFDPLEVNGTPFQGVRRVHPSAQAMGVDITANPSRDFTWVGLRHKGTGKSVLRINVHPAAGATNDKIDVTVRRSQWKNWSIQQYWLDILAFTAREMSRGVKATSERRFWDVILMGGDYNADLMKTQSDEWYYPSQMLPALWMPDTHPAGLDHLQHVYGSDVKVTKRWVVDGHTDHRIHFATMQFAEVDDTPGL